MQPIQALILDMDGVIWRGNQPIGNLPAIFERLKGCNLKVALATNNATLSARQYQEKLAGFGVSVEIEQIVNSGQAAARYLQRLHPQGGQAFIVGEDGLKQEFARFGFTHGEDRPLAVVAGLDRTINYEKLERAALLIRAGVLFIGTNPDVTYPTPSGLSPGAGAVLAFLSAAAETQPVIIGKPNPEMYLLAMERMGIAPEGALVVGDRLETDIAGAQAIGSRTALVLSGVTSPAAAAAWRPAPDWIAPDLTGLLDII